MSQFPQLDFSLGETIDLLRQSVRDFVAAEITPNAAESRSSSSAAWPSWKKVARQCVLP